jgi:hypothetical protein
MSDLLARYRSFIATKALAAHERGFEPAPMPALMFPHQRLATEFACRAGRSALFLDTGLGKSYCEIEFARQCAARTGKPSLILTPLAVARQMQSEAARFDIEASVIREAAEVVPGINIANYERMAKLDPSVFGAVILDESSILKAYTGATKRALCEAFRDTPYRLCATATPAPNDHMELGNHAEFLGIMPAQEMLMRWFINDTSTASQDWRLKGHAEADFWSWVASWSRCASMPSDLGGDDDGFVLPPLRTVEHIVEADRTEDTGGALFRMPELSATSFHAEKRLTLSARISAAASLTNIDDPVIVWCETDAESGALAKAIPDAVEVKGSLPLEVKEDRLSAFTEGRARLIVTKARIAGFGLNWQHCARMVFASISFSYEQHYQATRRCWRFGQLRLVESHIVLADTERSILEIVRRKSADHDRMKAAMAKAMRGAMGEQQTLRRYEPKPSKFPAWMRSDAA